MKKGKYVDAGDEREKRQEEICYKVTTKRTDCIKYFI